MAKAVLSPLFFQTKTLSIKLSPQVKIYIERFNDTSLRSEYKNKKLISFSTSDIDSLTTYCFPEEPNLIAKVYTAFNYFAGPTDCYDSCKSSFDYQFLLDVRKNENLSQYIWTYYHYRSSLFTRCQEIVSLTDPRNADIVHNINEHSDENFNSLERKKFHYNFLSVLMKELELSNYKPLPFIRGAPSDYFLYGYDGKEYFTKTVDHEINLNAYEDEIEKFNKNHSVPSTEN